MMDTSKPGISVNRLASTLKGDKTKKFCRCLKKISISIAINCRISDMGITSIQNSLHTEHLFAVGSYDDHLRIYDIRNLKQSLFQTNMGGGVWRIKWNPHKPLMLATCCMRTGFYVHALDAGGEMNQHGGSDAVNAIGDIKSVKVVGSRRQKCEPIAYGIDWNFEADPKKPDLLAICSFYDNQCEVWKPKLTFD